jgi:XRE family aerobic/anaerobic benzoate catabolism transcriptional regulator
MPSRTRPKAAVRAQVPARRARRAPEQAPGRAPGRNPERAPGAPLLAILAERVRAIRARRGLTRKALAEGAGISERHLANLESGSGNASILILQQVATALQCPLAALLGDVSTTSPEWLLIRNLLDGRGEADLRRARLRVAELFGASRGASDRMCRIALVGLRGAGKSTLGRMLAEDLGRPFVELNREIARIAGCSVAEIHALYGANAYRRYERQALEQTLDTLPEAVIATPGGIVSEAATFGLLIGRCFTVWLRATPEEHMGRVVAQGDTRPMAGHREAMDDLKRILAGRTDFYAKADLAVETSGRTLMEAFAALRAQLGHALDATA